MKVFVYSRKGHKRLEIIKNVIKIISYTDYWKIEDCNSNVECVDKSECVISVYAW